MSIMNQFLNYAYIDRIININEEFISSKIKELQPRWSNFNCVAKKLQIIVDKDLLVKINDTDEVLIKPEYGLTIDYSDKNIISMEALTAGVHVYAVIGY